MNLETTLVNVTFKNTIWVASGTFGYAKEYEDFIDLNTIGAIVTKTITLNPRTGNPPPRIIETPSGMLNAIGLTNSGVDAFIKTQSQYIKQLNTKIIISIAGNSKEEFTACINKLEQYDFFDAIELNLSCPNVNHKTTKHKLTAQDADITKEIISAARKVTQRPLIAKLTPQVTDITLIAKAAEEAGADAVALSNTYSGMATLKQCLPF